MGCWHVQPLRAAPVIPVAYRRPTPNAGDRRSACPFTSCVPGHSGALSPAFRARCRRAPGVSVPLAASRPDRVIVADCRRAWAVGSRYSRAFYMTPVTPVLHRQPPSDVGGGLPICPQARVHVGHSGAPPPVSGACWRREPDVSARATWPRPFRLPAASFHRLLAVGARYVRKRGCTSAIPVLRRQPLSECCR